MDNSDVRSASERLLSFLYVHDLLTAPCLDEPTMSTLDRIVVHLASQPEFQRIAAEIKSEVDCGKPEPRWLTGKP
jgi:hypothetical protein